MGAGCNTRRQLFFAPGVAHVLGSSVVQVRVLVLLGLGLAAEVVDVVDHLTQVVAALDAVFYLAENLPDLVLDRVRAGGLRLETGQVRKELLVDEVEEIVEYPFPSSSA